MATTIISLTTIPPRMGKIGATLESLLSQEAQIDNIILWIPLKYRRAEFNEFKMPALPNGIEVRRCEIDYGPATKVLPACKEFKGCKTRIIYCDDDRIYDSSWAKRLLSISDDNPNACITEEGEVLEFTLKKIFRSTLLYQALKKVTFSLLDRIYRLRMRSLAVKAGPVDICKGYGGVLVRPEFINTSAYTIPNPLWTVDDIWISGHLTVAGIPILKTSPSSMSYRTDLAEINALEDYTFNGYNRQMANKECILYFQKKYNIWQRRISPLWM